MSSFAEKYTELARRLLPAPFTIAVLLTFLVLALAMLFTHQQQGVEIPYLLELLNIWKEGLWNNDLMVFALQMMLMLVLGHVLALTKPFNRLVSLIVQFCTNNERSAAIVTFFSALMGFFNWGLGLIFGAILARKVAENASAKNYKINYPLIGAAGYTGLLVWHGGLSGSAPIKIAEPGHFFEASMGVIDFSQTIFSPMNIFCSILLLTVLPLAMFLLGKRLHPTPLNLHKTFKVEEHEKLTGAEKLDHSRLLSITVALVILFLAAFEVLRTGNLGVITPDFINFTLLGLGLLLHGSFSNFVNAVEKAIGGAAGILIQFPLYFGIMAIMNQSGLVDIFSNFFVNISNQVSYPIYTFLSAGIVNIFVPSGGGQWGVQGQIIIDAARSLDVSLPKSVMAMAYGDQLTNMLQPFWALPLLGITGLKAKDIVPYTLFLMFTGGAIFVVSLLLF